MEFTREFCVTLIIQANEITTGNIEKNLIEKAKEMFEGVCCGGSYVKSIDKIISRSNIIINKELTDGSGTCDVFFRATCVKCEKYDIVCLEMDKMKGQKVMFKNEMILACIDKSSITKNLKPGDIMPLVILEARHTRFAKNIHAIAVPYTHTDHSIVYKLTTAAMGKDVVSSIEQLQEKCKKYKLDKKTCDMFYGYKKAPGKIAGLKPIEIIETDFSKYKFPEGDFYIATYFGNRIEDALIYIFDQDSQISKFEPHHYIVEINSAGIAIMQLLSGFLEFRNTVETMSKIKNNKNVIDLYNKIKK